ncbi:hypothetical protein D3C77_518810 [compost metagenome]
MALLADGRRQAVDAHRTAVELLDHGQQQAPVLMIEATFVDIQQVERHVGDGLGDMALATYFGKITHTAQQAVGNSRRTPRTPGDLESSIIFDRQAKNAARATDNGGQVFGVIELKTLDDAKAVAQGVGQHACTCGGADQGKGGQVELDRAGCRAFADHDVELEILHGRVQHFLDDR